MLVRRCIYQLSPTALKQPSPPARGEEVPLLSPDGAGLPTLLSVLSGAERGRVDRIEQQFTKAVPSLAGFRVLPTPDGGHRLAFKLAGGGAQVEAAQVSDGALFFLAFLSMLHHPRSPGVLLLEEPENGVHPSRLRDIVRLLRGLTKADGDRPATQVIMTTHSPYLLDEVRPEEAFFFHRREDGGATATRFDGVDKIAERLQDYGLGELWTAYGEERLAALADAK